MCTHMCLLNRKRSATCPSAAPRAPAGPEQPACSCSGVSQAAASTQGSAPSHTEKAEAPESCSPSWETSLAGLCFTTWELQSPQGATIQWETSFTAGQAAGSQGPGVKAAPGAAVGAQDSCGTERCSTYRSSLCIRSLWSAMTQNIVSCGIVF